MNSKENTVLRASLNPQMVSVIPNAIVASQFKPDPGAVDKNFITIVVASRMVYRKGIDLLVAIIPRICQTNPKVRFIIGGDGPKKIDLEQMREKYLLHDRVELLGPVRHHEIRNILTKGQIFLNTSLTEAFCMGILEAACCGLLVVSTKVGGVPEVLPRHMIIFANPEEDDLVNAVMRAIEMIVLEQVSPIKFHDEIKEMYSWVNVAERTEKVYDKIWELKTPPLLERLRLYYGCGIWAGKIFCIVMAVDYLLWRFLEWIFPEENIEIAPPFPYQKYIKICKMAEEENNNKNDNDSNNNSNNNDNDNDNINNINNLDGFDDIEDIDDIDGIDDIDDIDNYNNSEEKGEEDNEYYKSKTRS